MRPRIVVTRKLPDAVEARLARDYDAALNPGDEVYGPDDLLRLVGDADGVLTAPTERWDAGLVGRLPGRVRVIATFSVGFEHVDLDACRARGIAVTNTPDVLTEATADVAMLCLLGAARRAWEGETMLREGRWGRWAPTGLLGLGLGGKVLGIVGMGRIGQATARRARGFGLEIHYHNRSRLPPEREEGATYHATLESLLPLCRFLSLHCPGGGGTERLLDERAIGLLPTGAVVVNTARGSLVDDEALSRRCAQGKCSRPGSTCSRANRRSTRATANRRTASCSPTSAAPRSRLATPWASAASTTWTRSSAASGRRTRSRKPAGRPTARTGRPRRPRPASPA